MMYEPGKWLSYSYYHKVRTVIIIGSLEGNATGAVLIMFDAESFSGISMGYNSHGLFKVMPQAPSGLVPGRLCGKTNIFPLPV